MTNFELIQIKRILKIISRKRGKRRKQSKRHYSYLSSLKPRKTILRSSILRESKDRSNLKIYSKIQEFNDNLIDN